MRVPPGFRLLIATVFAVPLLGLVGYFVQTANASPAREMAAAITGQTPTLQSEWLVTTSSTCLTSLAGRKALELYNNGPNTIWCNLTGAAVLNKSRPITAGSSWALDLTEHVRPCCLASTANQVTGAATITTQVR